MGKIEALQEQLEDERAERNVLDKKQVHVILWIYVGNQATEGCLASRTLKA